LVQAAAASQRSDALPDIAGVEFTPVGLRVTDADLAREDLARVVHSLVRARLLVSVREGSPAFGESEFGDLCYATAGASVRDQRDVVTRLSPGDWVLPHYCISLPYDMDFIPLLIEFEGS
jgi:hypothetical protein